MITFNELREKVPALFKDYSADSSVLMEVRRKALLGSEKERAFLCDTIQAMLDAFYEADGELDEKSIPMEYKSLDLDVALYEDVFGIGQAIDWYDDYYSKRSPELRITSNGNVFYKENGKFRLRAYKFTPDRLEQLKHTIMWASQRSLDLVTSKLPCTVTLNNGTVVTITSDNEIIMKRDVIGDLSDNDIALLIADTIMQNTQYPQFNPAIVKSIEFSSIGFELTLIDGRTIAVNCLDYGKKKNNGNR